MPYKQDTPFSEDLYNTAQEFILGELSAPPETVEEFDWAFYDYRKALLRTAFRIIGGDADGTGSTEYEIDDGEFEEEDE